jgi:hypothetical protein
VSRAVVEQDAGAVEVRAATDNCPKGLVDSVQISVVVEIAERDRAAEAALAGELHRVERRLRCDGWGDKQQSTQRGADQHGVLLRAGRVRGMQHAAESRAG